MAGRDSTSPTAAPEPSSAITLRLLVPFLVLFGVGLFFIAGGPRMPDATLEVPDLLGLESLLRSPRPPVDGAIYVVGMLGWAVWAWLVLSLVLQAFAVVAERLAAGAAWVKTFRSAADWLSAPLVRRAVEASLAGSLFVRVAVGVPGAVAAPLQTAAVVAAVADGRSEARAAEPTFSAKAIPGSIAYTVQPGDNLFKIAERFYGDGDRWVALYETNQGRRMADGRTFDRAGVIHAGWVLEIPGPTEAVQIDESGRQWYTVRRGDTLSGVAARLLGDGTHWVELFERNRDSAQLADGRTLTNPNLIWPGLRLQLSDEEARPEPGPVSPSEGAAEAEPVSSTRPEASASPLPTALPVTSPTSTPATAPEVTSEDLTATAPVVDAELAGDAHVQPAPATGNGVGVPPPVAGVAGLGLVAAGGVLLTRRWRRRRSERALPENEIVVEGGFARPNLGDLTGGREARGGAVDVPGRLACALERWFGELALTDTTILGVRYGRSAITFTLAGSLAERSRLLDELASFAAQNSLSLETRISADQDLLVRFTGATQSLAAMDEDGASDALLLPLGVLPDRSVFAVNWRALGHVVVASRPGRGADAIALTMLTMLAARCRPAQLHVWTLAAPHALPDTIAEMPHQTRGFIDPSDAEAVGQALEALEIELDRRIHNAGIERDPEVVLLVAELGSVEADSGRLERILREGAAHGFRMLAATTESAGPQSSLLHYCTSRVVLRLLDETASMALLGSGDAVYLEGGGRFMARVEGREAFEAHGFRIPADHLDRLVHEMLQSYGAGFSFAGRSEPEQLEDPSEPVSDVRPAAPEAKGLHTTEPAPRVVSIQPDSEPALAGENRAQAAGLPGPWLVTPPFVVQLFGGPRLLHRGRLIEPGPEGISAKLYELIMCLGSLAPGTATTAVLGQALWPGDDVDSVAVALRKARSRLREGLARLEPDLPKVVVRSDGDGVQLDPTVFGCDVHQFLALEQRARELRGRDAMATLEAARALYRGDLLAGGAEAVGYRWLDNAAGDALVARYRALHREGTRGLARLCAQEGHVERAISLYEELIETDPGDERLWRVLFGLYHDVRDQAALEQAWERLLQVLQEPPDEWDDDNEEAGSSSQRKHPQNGNLGAEPEPETKHLYRRLLDELRPHDQAPLARTTTARR
jgi:nucleoid-associated protein YgaU/DNA-binding SARP family transcriptional activator